MINNPEWIILVPLLKSSQKTFVPIDSKSIILPHYHNNFPVPWLDKDEYFQQIQCLGRLKETEMESHLAQMGSEAMKSSGLLF